MKKNDYFIDVSGWQPADLTSICQQVGTSNTIIKLTEGTGYINTNATGQVQTSNSIGFYHFARFSGNVQQAIAEANFFLTQIYRYPSVTYLVCDYEEDASSDINANTQAILEFMRICRNAGYQPLYYSSVDYTNNHVNVSEILQEFPNSIWIAGYPYGYQIVVEPDFNYFPSMDGVRFWQFTSTALAGGLDKNVVLLDDETRQNTQPMPQNENKLKVYKVDDLQYVNGLWQVRCNELVPVEFDWTENGIAVGDIDIVYENGTYHENQTTFIGSYFTFNESKVSHVGQGQYGSGDFFWIPVTLSESGLIWLSAWNYNHLIYK